jgi:uncharacterized membrane protein YhaH (DUF805 family)
MLSLLRAEFSFKGRLGRAGFWLRHLILLPLALWITSAAALTGAGGILAFLLIVWLVSVWSRRLHDRGLIGWWLLALVVPFFGLVWLWWQCGFRGTSPWADERFGALPVVDHLRVGTSHVA